MEAKETLKGKLQRRELYLAWLGKTLVDYTCRACLAVVPEPEKGCRHCIKATVKQEVAKESFKAFCEVKKAEKEALRVELGIPKKPRGRTKGYTLRRPRSDKGHKRGPRRPLADPRINPVVKDAVSPALNAWLATRPKKRGRPKGSKDSKPRTRRTRK